MKSVQLEERFALLEGLTSRIIGNTMCDGRDLSRYKTFGALNGRKDNVVVFPP